MLHRRLGERIDETSPVVVVSDAVAEVRGVEPGALPPIQEAIDPEGLNAVCQSLEEGQLTFEYAGTTVTVDHTGAVEVVASES